MAICCRKCPYVPDHLYRTLIVGDYGSGKTNALLNLISQQPGIDKICLYAKDPHKPRYKLLIKRRKDVGKKHYHDSKAFIEYSNTRNDVCNNIKDHNPNRMRKIFIVFGNMIADISTIKNFQTIVKELFIRCRELNVSLVLITQSYFSVPKNNRLNSTHYLIMNTYNKIELQ